MTITTNIHKYRGIPEPSPEVHSLYQTVAALKEVVETLTRQRGYISESAVTVEDLIELGIITRESVRGIVRSAN
jgi:hypothetical protein